MRIQWEIDAKDIGRVKTLMDAHRDSALVQERTARNVERRGIALSREVIWAEIVGCLVTTQNHWAVAKKLLQTEPFPLSYDLCRQAGDARTHAESVLQHTGLRRWRRIAEEVATNLSRLEGEHWDDILRGMEDLRNPTDCGHERDVADRVDDKLLGFGPKQARNLLQGLGLTRYEVPIDSRVAKWLTTFEFPAPVSAGALGDRRYYHFVSDGLQHLCTECGVYPCIVDAAIFVSFERERFSV